MGICSRRNRSNYRVFVADRSGGFSSMEMCRAQDSEKLVRNGRDRRRRMRSSWWSWWQWPVDVHHKAVGKLLMRYNTQEGPKWWVGTAFIAKDSQTNKVFILTAGHNLRQLSVPPAYQTPIEVVFRWKEDVSGESVQEFRFRADQLKVNPGYCGWQSAADAAIIKFDQHQLEQLGPDPPCLLIDDNVCKRCNSGVDIMVAGYPGEKYGLWEDAGKVDSEGDFSSNAYYTACEQQRPRMLARHYLDTTGGQSGSPVVKTSNTGRNLMVLGIHVAGIDGHGNYATSIKQDILVWIRSQVS